MALEDDMAAIAPFLDKAAANGIDRSRFAAELAANPALREKVMAIAAGENNNPRSNLDVIESMMNRADMMGTPLAQETRIYGRERNGYYAGYNPSALNNPTTRAMISNNIEKALANSNSSNFATDNSSEGKDHFTSRRYASGMYAPTLDGPVNGEYFSKPNSPAARGYAQYDPWLARVSGPQNAFPQAEDDKATAAFMGGAPATAQPAPPAVDNTAVASATQAAPAQTADASAEAGPAPQGFFGSIATAAGASPQTVQDVNDLSSHFAAANKAENQQSANAAGQLTADSKESDDVLKNAQKNAQAAASAAQFMPFKPLDMSRVAAVIQRLQGPMGTAAGGLGADQQQSALGSYFGAIG